jgi:steroid 5-alpha reductase family enzyme
MSGYLVVAAVNLWVVLLFMFIIWLISLAKRDTSIVDPFWGLGFVLVVWVTYAQTDSLLPRRLIVPLLTTIWGVRLSLHLFIRNWGKGEDRRYTAMRLKQGPRFWLVSLWSVFGLQGVLLWLVSLVIQAGVMAGEPASLTWLDYSGIIVWLVGFLFETIGDRQLMRFKANPENRGKVMDRGLWAYTRHPNYFGETLVWWGMYLLTASTPGGWWFIVSPLVMTFLLLRVSGVTLLEKTIIASRPGYDDYVRRTSAFIPRPPKPVAAPKDSSE